MAIYKPPAGANIVDRASGATVAVADGKTYYELSAASGLGGNQYGPQIGDPVSNPSNKTLQQLNAESGGAATPTKDFFGNNIGDQAGNVAKAQAKAVAAGTIQYNIPKTATPINTLTPTVNNSSAAPKTSTPALSNPFIQTNNTAMPSNTNISGVTKQLDPGMTDPQVLALQKFLNANGFPVASSGPGSPGNETSYFGPATEAALKQYQATNGIVNSGTPQSTGYGRVGPQTLSSIQTITSRATPSVGGNGGTITSGSAGNGGGGGAISVDSTGNESLDAVLKGYTDLADSLLSKGYTIPKDMEITPDLISQFTSYAHKNVDPYYQQLLSNEITGVNASLKDMAVQYQGKQAGIVQDFGTNLANEQETAGGTGTAFSGLRNINERNLTNSANRSLASLDSSTGLSVGNTLRSGAADVGAENAGQFNLPTFAGASVSTNGGSRGSSSVGGNLDLSYDPSIFRVGNIGAANKEAANTLKNTYLGQYGTLANSQSGSGRSISDLIGMMGLN